MILCVALFTAATMCGAVPGASHERASHERVSHKHEPPDAAQADKKGAHTWYQINLTLDLDARSYTGLERVRWTNRDDHPASVLYFHLYSNTRAQRNANAPASRETQSNNGGSNNSSSSVGLAEDEPRLEIIGVSSAAKDTSIPYSLDEQATILRVNLREPVAPGASTEVFIKFRGSVPEIDSEETTLSSHVLQQVGAALRSERETRRARDLNFRCRGVILLGTAYPVLATRYGDDWQRKVEMSIGDMVFTETADYRVKIDAPADVALFTSGESIIGPAREEATAGTATAADANPSSKAREFGGANLRDFAIVAGRSLRATERRVGDVNVRSIFMAEHETTARRVLNVAAEAARVYAARFGPLPYKTISVVELPLVAGMSSTEFAGLGAMASAFYVDFDSPLMRNLPEIVREQRASLEDSLEFTVAHLVAHQWWGAAVGNDPARNPVLDEALANWSALLYYQDVYGEARAQIALDDQLRGVYKIYRTFGGEDMEATRAARDYRNAFQYAAIVASKGALMFAALRRLLGDEKYFAALGNYYRANIFSIVEVDDLRNAFLAAAPPAQKRDVARLFARWLNSKRGDEDIAPPDPNLAAALGVKTNAGKGGDHNAFTRLGKFFWQQMTRIR
ncbi:MAG TPA: M1 family aminopeptidase [Pyrinomonadaceae bacterium]|nr:M1 family aminopeptidase [Pyrinomonadaceae bacterium]